MNVFEPTRGEEYSRILQVRAGEEPDGIFTEETKEIRKKIRDLFGHEWAAGHNQYALLSLFQRIALECGEEEIRQDLRIFKDGLNEYTKSYILNYTFRIFKIAWINYKEILPKETDK